MDDGTKATLTSAEARNSEGTQRADEPEDVFAVSDTVSKPTDEAHQVPAALRLAADRILAFLSTASNEKIGACLVGLGAVTYVVLGRVGLVLIGAVGGAALHATWDGSRGGGGEEKAVESSRRREVGMDVVHRILDWRQKKTLDDDTLNLEIQRTATAMDFSDFRPETAEALNALTDAVIRDYVKWWYSPILPEDIAFPSACRKILTSFILSISSHLYRKRPADTFLDFTTNSSSIFIVVLNELSHAITASPQATTPDAVDAYLRLKPQCNLANLMDEQHQKRKLLMVADDILESFLDQHVYRNAPARIFLREILANVILEGTIKSCSRSEWINEWIIYLLEDAEPDLMNAIDAGVVNSAAQEITGVGKVDVVANETSQRNTTAARSEASENHKRTLSRAEEAMEEAMREAQRLTQMMVEEDARRGQDVHGTTPNLPDDISESTGNDVETPTSSQSEPNGEEEKSFDEAGSQRSNVDHTTAISRSNSEANGLDHLPASQARASVSVDSLGIQQPLQEALTLYKARISIFDDGGPADRRPLKSKPIVDYMIQIEPISASFRGWMIVRTYTDFETLHEVLSRIAKIGGIPFQDAHANLPAWKGSTKATLRDELERYLLDALNFEGLAESEGMKRFLEKDRGVTRSPNNKSGGFWPGQAFETMGKGMVDVLTTVPKGVAGGGKAVIGGVAGGGKAVIGGVTNVLGGGAANAANKKPAVAPAAIARQSTSSLTDSSRMSTTSFGTESSRESSDTKGKSSTPPSNGTRPSLDIRRGSSPGEQRTRVVRHSSPVNLLPGNEPSSTAGSRSPDVQLPPLPTEISDDYMSPPKPQRPKVELPAHTSHMSVDGTSFFDVPTPPPTKSRTPVSPAIKEEEQIPKPTPPRRAQSQARVKVNKQPINEQEAQVTVELLFAVINELYTLSSAWQIRRTLLTAAKTFLLRPGNPQLENIRILLQESLLDSNTSDEGMALHLHKLRENSLPTEEELASWPPPPDEKRKEELRKKARKLLVERGMPQALTSVMGAAASGEALGKVFDCLQIEGVARGVMFGLMLQGIRAITQ